MSMFIGTLGLLLGVLVMLAGASTFARGLPDGVELRPGQSDPQGDVPYLAGQEALGFGVVLLALDVVFGLDSRPFLYPGVLLLVITFVLWVLRVRSDQGES